MERIERITRQVVHAGGPFNNINNNSLEIQLSNANNNEREKVCLIVGAGDGLGAALTKKFANEKYYTVICRRNIEKSQPLIDQILEKGGKIKGIKCDARKEEEVINLFSHIEKEIGEIKIVIFNIGANVPESILTETSRKYYKIWEMATFSGFLIGREAAKSMVKSIQLHRDQNNSSPSTPFSILFSGATEIKASIRGKSKYAAFSGAKSALRSLAQSMARELGPMGVHVAHIIIDGAVNSNSNLEDDQLLQADQIAEVYYQISHQPKSCWTFELDLRSHVEIW